MLPLPDCARATAYASARFRLKVAGAAPAVSFRYWDANTLGGLLRPLPRTWGVDRMPCSTGKSIDIFREGDFDYPYLLKMLDRVSSEMFTFASAPSTKRGYSEAGCLDRAFVNPLKMALLDLDIRKPTVNGEFGIGSANAEAYKMALDGWDSAYSHPTTGGDLTSASISSVINLFVVDEQSWISTDSVGNEAPVMFNGTDFVSAGVTNTDGSLDTAAIATGTAALLNSLAAAASEPAVKGVFDLLASDGNAAVVSALEADIQLGITFTGYMAKGLAAFVTGVDPRGAPCSLSWNARFTNVAFASLAPDYFKLTNEAPYNTDAALLPENAAAMPIDNFLLSLTGIYPSGDDSADFTTDPTLSCKDLAITHAYVAKYAMDLLQQPVFGLVEPLATAVGANRGLASQMRAQWPTISQAYFAFGYWYRPTYGDHWTHTGAAPDDDFVINTIDDALATYYADYSATTIGQYAPREMCALGTSEPANPALPTAFALNACVITWAGTAIPPGLLMAGFTYQKPDGSTRSGLAVTPEPDEKLVHLGTHRVARYDFAKNNWLSVNYFSENFPGTTAAEKGAAGDAAREEIHRSLEGNYDKHLEPMWADSAGSGFGAGETFSGERFVFNVDRSTGDVVVEASKIDTVPLVGCYVALFFYVALMSSSWQSSVHSHFFLGFSGVLVIGIAIVGSIGLAVYAGVKINPVVFNVCPLLALGIGIDDLYVILSAYNSASRRKSNDTVGKVLTEAIGETGPSITFTSITNFLAFAIASTTPIGVVQVFAQTMTVMVVFNYMMLLLLFVPMMGIDARRTLAGRSDFCCNNPDQEAAAAVNVDSTISTFFEKRYGPFLMRSEVRALVVAAFLAFLSFQIHKGVNDTVIGLQTSDITAEGTHQNEFFAENENNYPLWTASLLVNTRDYADEGVQLAVQMAAENLGQSKWLESPTRPPPAGFMTTWLAQIVGTAKELAGAPSDVVSSHTFRSSPDNVTPAPYV